MIYKPYFVSWPFLLRTICSAEGARFAKGALRNDQDELETYDYSANLAPPSERSDEIREFYRYGGKFQRPFSDGR